MTTVDGVEQATAMLRDCWSRALHLQAARQAWSQLAPATVGYINFGPMLWGWYRDHIVIGCRRLLDTTKGTVSLMKALELLWKHSPTVTRQRLAALDAGHPYADELTSGRMRLLAEIVTGDTETPVAALTKGAVRREIDRLKADYKQIVTLSNQVVAHQSASPDPITVEHDEVDALLADVVAIAQRWVGLLDASHLSDDVPMISGVGHAARALRLYDKTEFVKALSEAHFNAMDSGDPVLTSITRDDLEERARIEFRFDERPSTEN